MVTQAWHVPSALFWLRNAYSDSAGLDLYPAHRNSKALSSKVQKFLWTSIPIIDFRSAMNDTYLCCHLKNGNNKRWQIPFTKMWCTSPDSSPCPHYKYMAFAARAATQSQTPSSTELPAMAEGLGLRRWRRRRGRPHMEMESPFW
jgi:hypothetical protein